jgi:hypothetical protein
MKLFHELSPGILQNLPLKWHIVVAAKGWSIYIYALIEDDPPF